MDIILKDFPKGVEPDEAFKEYWWEFEAKEARAKKRVLEQLEIRYISDEECGFTTVYAAVPFQRIRRITGYLVGDISRWNNGKIAELNERVPHGIN
ncbi:MAG: hypothetical protein LBM93_13095 [Oscillospiraceae bacterium]|jgi:anaerobic ribonucleoside-triphosphate reductase|nr:hypothetical protein [Oscillospiraceae bacterium]